jgi:hypothetical protein
MTTAPHREHLHPNLQRWTRLNLSRRLAAENDSGDLPLAIALRP